MTREEAIKRLEDTFEGWNMWVMDNDSPASKMSKALGMAIAALREQPRWISVDERLPKRFGRVLVWDEEEDAVGEAEYDGENFKWVEDENLAFATHWMPLPEPPSATR